MNRIAFFAACITGTWLLAQGPALAQEATVSAPEAGSAMDAAPAADTFLVLLEPDVDVATLERAWAVLGPSFRVAPGSRFVQVEIARGFEIESVLALMRQTRGVAFAEPDWLQGMR